MIRLIIEKGSDILSITYKKTIFYIIYIEP